MDKHTPIFPKLVINTIYRRNILALITIIAIPQISLLRKQAWAKMHFFSFLITTMALAASSVYALPQGTDDDTICLRLCRDAPFQCQAGWESTQIGSGDQVCYIPLFSGCLSAVQIS